MGESRNGIPLARSGAVCGSLLRFTLVLAIVASTTRCTVINAVIASDKREIYHFAPSFSVDSPDFRRSLDTLGQAMVTGNSVELLKNGDQIFPAMVEAIGRARASVNLESYIFRGDRAGRIVADALISAARRGVEVRLLVDAVGGKLGALAAEMKQAGVKVHTYRPIRLISIYRLGRRTHRKILVVDGRVCFTGGLGIADAWLGDARNPREWRDTQVRAEGPVAAQMQSIFSEDWTYTTGEIIAGGKFYPEIKPAGTVSAQAIKASRGDPSSFAKMVYYISIQSAQHTIQMENAYFIPDAQSRQALVNAARRGVDVQVIVAGLHIDLPFVRSASRNHYGELLEGGVKIFEYAPTMMHNKTMVVDGIYSTIGSINFDARSMNTNAEESLAFYDRGIAGRMEEMFREDLARSRPVTFQNWKHRGLGARLSETIFWIWEPYY
jgi:cardiolipin synthase A/B